MTQQEARKYAYLIAATVIEEKWLNAESYDWLQGLPKDDGVKIENEVRKIVETLFKKAEST